MRGGLLLAALLLPAAANAVTGAAALSPKQYKASLARISKEADQSQAVIERGLKSKSVAVLVTSLGQFAKAQDRLANEIAALKAPANAATANRQLAQGFHDIASAVGGVQAKARKARTVAQATAILNRDRTGARAGAEVDQALARLRRLGYTPGS